VAIRPVFSLVCGWGSDLFRTTQRESHVGAVSGTGPLLTAQGEHGHNGRAVDSCATVARSPGQPSEELREGGGWSRLTGKPFPGQGWRRGSVLRPYCKRMGERAIDSRWSPCTPSRTWRLSGQLLAVLAADGSALSWCMVDDSSAQTRRRPAPRPSRIPELGGPRKGGSCARIRPAARDRRVRCALEGADPLVASARTLPNPWLERFGSGLGLVSGWRHSAMPGCAVLLPVAIALIAGQAYGSTITAVRLGYPPRSGGVQPLWELRFLRPGFIEGARSAR